MADRVFIPVRQHGADITIALFVIGGIIPQMNGSNILMRKGAKNVSRPDPITYAAGCPVHQNMETLLALQRSRHDSPYFGLSGY
jgi:hypothetical protein